MRGGSLLRSLPKTAANHGDPPHRPGGTFAQAWSYPGQEKQWHMVSLAKYGSWYLLMLISFVLVTLVQPVRAPD